MKMSALFLSFSALAFSAAAGAYEGFNSIDDPTQPTITARRAAPAKVAAPGRHAAVAHGKRDLRHRAERRHA